MTLLLTLLRALLVLSVDDGRPSVVKSCPLAAGAVYRLKNVRARGEGGPWCFSVLEERGNEFPNRALYLGCHKEGAAPLASFHDLAVAGGRGRAYSVVVFRPPGATAPVSALVTVEIDKERGP